MAVIHTFYYFGDDEGYFRTLQGEFQRNTRIPFEFKRFFETSESAIQSLFLKIYKEHPAVVFLDFSKHTQDYLHLARLIARTPLEHKMVTVGLVDYLSDPQIMSESIATGVNFTHIKSPETFDVVYGVSRLVAPAEGAEHGFATANLKDEWDAGIPGKVGYIDAESMHIETNFPVAKGSRIKVKHGWQKSKVIPSGEVFVRETANKNLFFHFSGSADLNFLFVDDFLPPEGMEPDRIKEKRIERDDMIKHHKKQFRKWIEDNASKSDEKKGKMLVIDRELRFYDGQSRSDKHSYIIRVIPFIDNISSEIDRMQPQVIAYAMDKDDEKARNTHQKLVKLAEAMKAKYKDLNPFIVVFNSPMDSKEMQSVLGYANVMATSNELSVDLLLKMAELYEKKRNSVMPVKTAQSDKLFLNKSNISSIVQILVSVKVMKLSETDMIFQCDQELATNTNIHMTQPVEMYVNVQPTKTPSKPPQYHGIIHCLGEAQKKDLRKFVNSVFFREHDAAVNTATEEFKKLNDTKLQEKIALAAKKLQEEMDKKEKEKAELEKKAAAASQAAAPKDPNEPKS
ncbi:MAG TPA: hypothetical protein VNJ08_01535 [Bacteriovoracaceae bacterium]|nr:hypothetical protein [Bacteriovoracaceae bacterium]